MAKKDIKIAKEFLAKCDNIAGAWFWGENNSDAASRAWREQQLSFEETALTLNGRKYQVALDVRVSRKYTYVYKTIIRDGVKTTMRAFNSDLEKELKK